MWVCGDLTEAHTSECCRLLDDVGPETISSILESFQEIAITCTHTLQEVIGLLFDHAIADPLLWCALEPVARPETALAGASADVSAGALPLTHCCHLCVCGYVCHPVSRTLSCALASRRRRPSSKTAPRLSTFVVCSSHGATKRLSKSRATLSRQLCTTTIRTITNRRSQSRTTASRIVEQQPVRRSTRGGGGACYATSASLASSFAASC